ncbi:hypothetical protein NPIL_128871, partial [Nephila pilipes]
MNWSSIVIVTTAFLCSYSLVLEAKKNNKKRNGRKCGTEGTTCSRMEEAIKYMDETDRFLSELAQQSAKTLWNWSVNMTDENRKEMEEKSRILRDETQRVFRESSQFNWVSFKEKNETLYRWFELASKGRYNKPTGDLRDKGKNIKKEEEDISAKMIEIYSKAKICAYPENGVKDLNAICDMSIS